MASNTYGAIKLSTAEDVGAVLKKKTGSADGYKPKEWAETINLMGLLPVRTASGSIAHFTDGADDVPLKSLTAQIVPIQSGTGDPSPSNPRPISGTDELTLKHDNENMLVMSTFDFTIQGERFYTTNEGNVIVNGSNTSGISSVAQDWKDNLTFTLPKGTFYFKATNLSNSTIAIRRKFDNYTFAQTYGTAVTFTLDEETELFIGIYSPENKSFDNVECNFMISVDNITYDVPNRKTYTIPLGRTVYGGSAEVVGGSGEVTRVVVTYDGTEDWHSEGTNNFYVDSGRGSGVYYGEDKLLCSHFKSTYGSLGHNNNVYISATGNLNLQCDDITHTADGIKTWCATQYANGTPLQICYELKTSTEYTFTGQPINSYLGVNNIWCDSGEVLDVEYRADMNLLIAELEG